MRVHGCLVVGETLDARTYPAGPTLVRGARSVLDADGNSVECRRRVIAICRCGRSRSAPMCDGTHRFVPGFDERGRGIVQAATQEGVRSDERPSAHAAISS
jgi:CDGSH-type Zn-finger protein